MDNEFENLPTEEKGIVIDNGDYVPDWQYENYIAGFSSKDIAWVKKHSRPARATWSWTYAYNRYDGRVPCKCNYKIEVI